jgi:hypothetical protein
VITILFHMTVKAGKEHETLNAMLTWLIWCGCSVRHRRAAALPAALLDVFESTRAVRYDVLA